MELVKHWAARLDDYVIDLAWAADGSQLAAASAAGPITLYDAASGASSHLLAGHEGGTNGLAWRPGASHCLASGGQDGRVKFWDAAAGQHVANAELSSQGAAWVEQLSWRPDGTALAAAAGRELVLLRADASIAQSLPAAPKSISALAWAPPGTALAAAYFGGVQLWSAEALAAAAQPRELPYTGGIATLAWSPDAHWLVSGNHDPSVHLWQPASDEELQMRGYETKVSALAFDHSGRWLATSGSSDCCVWDCSGAGPEGREPAMLPHDARVSALAFQNAHGLLAAGSQDGAVKLWSVERAQKPLRATVTMPAAATKLAWSPDDSLLAIGTSEGIVYVLKCRA